MVRHTTLNFSICRSRKQVLISFWDQDKKNEEEPFSRIGVLDDDFWDGGDGSGNTSIV